MGGVGKRVVKLEEEPEAEMMAETPKDASPAFRPLSQVRNNQSISSPETHYESRFISTRFA